MHSLPPQPTYLWLCAVVERGGWSPLALLSTLCLAAAAQLELMAAFPEDSITDESDAREEIWLDFKKFQDKHQALGEQSAKLAEVAARGDEAAMKEQFGATAKTCKGCHEEYRGPKPK